MSSTLYIRKTPRPTREEWHFKQPFKGIVARKFYDHDGSLGGGQMTIGSEELEWLRGVYAGMCAINDEDTRDIEKIIEHIEGGGTVDMWFVV